MTGMNQEARRRLLERRRALARLAEQAFGAAQASGAEVVAFEASAPAAVLGDWLGDEKRAELSRIDAALGRIDDGTYGLCIHCGRAIGRQRLLALPEYPCCLACAAAEHPRPAG